MSIPAPARFTDLREHLHTAGIDSAHLSIVLERYLAMPDNLPQHDWFLDPLDDHQAWAYRETINEFRAMTEEKPAEGNGDEEDSE